MKRSLSVSAWKGISPSTTSRPLAQILRTWGFSVRKFRFLKKAVTFTADGRRKPAFHRKRDVSFNQVSIVTIIIQKCFAYKTKNNVELKFDNQGCVFHFGTCLENVAWTPAIYLCYNLSAAQGRPANRTKIRNQYFHQSVSLNTESLFPRITTIAS